MQIGENVMNKLWEGLQKVWEDITKWLSYIVDEITRIWNDVCDTVKNKQKRPATTTVVVNPERAAAAVVLPPVQPVRSPVMPAEVSHGLARCLLRAKMESLRWLAAGEVVQRWPITCRLHKAFPRRCRAECGVQLLRYYPQ